MGSYQEQATYLIYSWRVAYVAREQYLFEPRCSGPQMNMALQYGHLLDGAQNTTCSNPSILHEISMAISFEVFGEKKKNCCVWKADKTCLLYVREH